MLVLIQFVKAIVCALAAQSVFVARLYDLGLLREGKRWLLGFLAVLALIAVPGYFDYGQYPKHGSFTNPHDFFHYYLGAKYWRELGYYDIYRAVVVANTENNGRVVNKSVRNQNTYNFESPQDIMRRASEYKGTFSAERWEQFRQDVAYFQSITKPSRWPGVTQDKGYNATPVWNMVASTITNYVAPASPGGFLFLVSLDLLLVAAALALTYAAFGPRTALFALLFFASHYTMSYPHIRGAFLRLDWVMCLVMAVCLVKLRWFKAAACLMAYAAMARIFPVVFVGGMGCKMLWDLYQTRRLQRMYLEFFCVFTACCAAIITLNIVYDGGLGHWQQFLEKIRMHDHDLAPVRVGFKYVFLNVYEATGGWSSFETAKLAEFEARKLEWYFVQGVVLLMFFAACRRLEAYESIALGYVPAFFLTAPTFYYHVMLVVPFLLFIPKIHLRGRAAGAAIMFGLSVLWYGLLRVLPFEDSRLSYCISVSLLFFCLYALAMGYFAPAPARVPESQDKSAVS